MQISQTYTIISDIKFQNNKTSQAVHELCDIHISSLTLFVINQNVRKMWYLTRSDSKFYIIHYDAGNNGTAVNVTNTSRRKHS